MELAGRSARSDKVGRDKLAAIWLDRQTFSAGLCAQAGTDTDRYGRGLRGEGRCRIGEAGGLLTMCTWSARVETAPLVTRWLGGMWFMARPANRGRHVQ